MNSSTEILELANAASASPEMSYAPVWISTDRREPDPTKTTLKYAQVGGPTKNDKIGNAFGPIYMIEFVDLSSITAAYIKIWGLDNDDVNAPIYPVTYLENNPKLEVWLKKFEFTDVDGVTVAAGGSYKIYGHRKRNFPAIF
jgi:hypothetical protein